MTEAVFRSTKHKGKTFQHVIDTDASFVQWALGVSKPYGDLERFVSLVKKKSAEKNSGETQRSPAPSPSRALVPKVELPIWERPPRSDQLIFDVDFPASAPLRDEIGWSCTLCAGWNFNLWSVICTECGCGPGRSRVGYQVPDHFKMESGKCKGLTFLQALAQQGHYCYSLLDMVEREEPSWSKRGFWPMFFLYVRQHSNPQMYTRSLILIFKHLDSWSDLFNVSQVCKSWRKAASADDPELLLFRSVKSFGKTMTGFGKYATEDLETMIIYRSSYVDWLVTQISSSGKKDITPSVRRLFNYINARHEKTGGFPTTWSIAQGKRYMEISMNSHLKPKRKTKKKKADMTQKRKSRARKMSFEDFDDYYDYYSMQIVPSPRKSAPRRSSRKRKLTVVPAFCLCRGPESGQMVNCDECDEWFHFECVDLDEAPEGNYMCPLCVSNFHV